MQRAAALLSLLAAMALAASAAAQQPPRPKIVKAAQVRGKPEIAPGDRPAIFFWSDQDGVHIRWSAPQPVLFSGRIDFDRPLAVHKRLADPGSGWVELATDRILLFSVTVRQGVDGLDMQVPAGKRVQMELAIDGAEPAVEQVLFGKDGAHPAGFPLLVYY
ncbi:MAG: hypothetical protein JXR96_24810 [Deltaproteobacteria bacterium]|nr:hypothetical protein [Deltaproteobacteria bacterium]